MKLKWKRDNPGHYSCDDFVIKGKGTNWELWRLISPGDLETSMRVKVCKRDSKGKCQDYANDHPDAGMPPKPQPKPKQLIPDKDSLESILASLRLDVCALTEMIGVLALEIRSDRQSRG